ncbi:MAG: ComEC/Rec2 family competence protein [Planctomycetota bacterium]
MVPAVKIFAMHHDPSERQYGRPEPWWPRASAAAWIVGIGAAAAWPSFWLWGAASIAASGLLLATRRSTRLRWRVAWVTAVFTLGAAWAVARAPDAADTSLAGYLQPDGALAEIEGVVADTPELREGTAGRFAAFGYTSPATHFMLDARRISTTQGPRLVAGRLHVKIDAAELDLKRGQRIAVRGWMSPLSAPKNPGDFDYRAAARDKGIVGRIRLPARGNWELLRPAAPLASTHGFAAWRTRFQARAAWSLGLGMGRDYQTLGLLQTLLLGQTTHDIYTLRERFRDVGLAHILSISGAHLGILMGLVWCVARLVIPSPPRAAVLVLAILALYLLAVPLRVPIVRASIMAGLYFTGVASGRRLGATTLLSLAALIVLVWRPSDLFSPGFQLSFLTVWALLRFVTPVSQAFWPDPLIPAETNPGRRDAWGWGARRAADVTAVSVVATATATPLVAYHFEMVNPMAVVLSVLALPVLTAVLAVGYLKIMAGFVLPSLALVLSGPLRWVGTGLSSLVEQAAQGPGATVRLSHGPPLWWAVAAVAVVWLWFAGWFRDRRFAGVAALLLVVGGLGLDQRRPAALPLYAHPILGADSVAAQLRLPKGVSENGHAEGGQLVMLSVADGSCFIWRSAGKTVVFDCGSQAYPLIGRRTVVPTLRRMGVKRIDVLVVSHADLDHYNGALDLADAFSIGEVWVSPNVVDEARNYPRRATAYLLDQLQAQALPVAEVVRGDERVLGDAHLRVLWPPREGWDAAKSNDRSVVMAIELAGRRLLLNGDIQQDAITALLEDHAEELDADVADLPHHGSVVEASATWLDAVSPGLVLQSTGRARLRRDRWPALLETRGTIRLVSEEVGMVRVEVSGDGRMTWATFLKPATSASEAAVGSTP